MLTQLPCPSLGTFLIWQLVFLKNALLLGVTFSYGTELIGVEAPTRHADGADRAGGGAWRAWAKTAASTATHQTAGGALDFKPNKMAEYSTGVGQGKCNLMQTSSLDAEFAGLRLDAAAGDAAPPGVSRLPYDALLLAEGEWSRTCSKLGISKTVDRFTQAIGLVINMLLDPAEPATKDPKMRSFTISPMHEVGKRLTAAKIGFEFAEYLKGETHYLVVVAKKAALLHHGVLSEDLPGKSLLTKANLDEPKLLELSRKIATLVGLPESTQFASFHPAKLFDFSTRARCVSAFRVLSVSTAGGGKAGGEGEGGGGSSSEPSVLATDLESQPYLCAQETAYMARTLATAEAEVAKKEAELAELRTAIVNLAATLAAVVEAREGPNPPELSAEEARVESVYIANEQARLEAFERSVIEEEEKLRVKVSYVDAAREKQAEWLGKVGLVVAAGVGDPEAGAAEPRPDTHSVPIFPVGDSVLEPFWPQGLGSNRGFHTALDAVWCVHVLHEEGLAAALLERNFWFDLVLQGPWSATGGLLRPAAGWTADPVTRYSDGPIARTKANYTNPQSKRLFRGEGATPTRIARLDLKPQGNWL